MSAKTTRRVRAGWCEGFYLVPAFMAPKARLTELGAVYWRGVATGEPAPRRAMARRAMEG